MRFFFPLQVIFLCSVAFPQKLNLIRKRCDGYITTRPICLISSEFILSYFSVAISLARMSQKPCHFVGFSFK